MTKIFITQKVHHAAEDMLKAAGYEVITSSKHGVLTTEELVNELATAEKSGAPYTALLSLLTNKIDKIIFDAAPSLKVVSNYAVGFNNIDLDEAKKRGIVVANAPGLSSDAVAEHTMALLLALAMRIVEGDDFVRAGKYTGWDPDLLWGTDLKGATLGLLGAGHIGVMVAQRARLGFDMNIVYYDVRRNEEIEKKYQAEFRATPEEVLKEADFVSVHVPLLPSTTHLLNAERFATMKSSAYFINTSRGPVVDEKALVEALKKGVIRGAALDVYENEPHLTEGLSELQNVILTPHIGSATEKTRESMSQAAAQNIIDFVEGRTPANAVH